MPGKYFPAHGRRQQKLREMSCLARPAGTNPLTVPAVGHWQTGRITPYINHREPLPPAGAAFFIYSMTPGFFAAPIHIVFMSVIGAAAMAQEVTQNFDFDHVVTGMFWQQLYPAGGWTLLCGQEFDPGRLLPDGRAVAVDHIYPLARMVKESGCRDRAQCRARPDGRFALMESDLHNLYPEGQELIAYRNGREFGIVDGEEWRFEDCDVEWRNGALEPRLLVRGNIARSILYMRATYRLVISDAMLELLKTWNREDPPSKQEQERNDAIEKLQGRRNPFIDHPARVENLRNLKKEQAHAP